MNVQGIRDWYRVRPGYWFRPKLFGWGAVPVTWQGWAATIGFVAIAILVARLVELRHNQAYLLAMVPVALGFVYLCWAKTDGAWRWRMGPGDEA